MMFGKWRRRLGGYFRDALAIWLGVRDPGIPLSAKLVGFASVVYFIMPMDLIPDMAPLVGWLDDAAMAPLGAYFASKLIPYDTMARLRSNADLLLMRLRPRFGRMLLVALAVWLLLAATGAYLMHASRNTDARPGAALPPHIVNPSQAVP